MEYKLAPGAAWLTGRPTAEESRLKRGRAQQNDVCL